MPQAAPVIGAVTGGVSLLDQIFGSGKDARDQQSDALGIQRDLANAQLPDTQRRTALNQSLQDILMGMFQNPQVPEQFLDLNGQDDTALYKSVGPGVMANSALNKLFGLGGNVGTGGIHGFSNIANTLGESRRDEFKDTVGALVQSLLQQGAQTTTPTQAPYYPNQGTEAFDIFNNPATFG